MIQLLPSWLRRLSENLDAFFAGNFWWRWKQRRAELALERSLAQYGEKSFAARRATEDIRELDFAVRFWRSAPLAVRRVALQAVDEGMPLEDVRMLVLNLDLYVNGDRVHLRRSRLLHIISVFSALLFWFHWFLMIVLTFGKVGPWLLKFAVALTVTAVYSFLYRGWSLYLSRACRTVRRRGGDIDKLIASQSKAATAVRHISVNGT